jgi:NAD(P)-dependent dehydrogenase (short-subunit alcohol dehydrogenase family)
MLHSVEIIQYGLNILYTVPPGVALRPTSKLMAMTDMFRLDGKVVVVTGGGRGIGVMMARGLLQAGATVYLSSRKKAEPDAAVAELSAHGIVHAIPADLGTVDGVQALVSDLAEREDAIHALFNNAGAAWGAPFAEFPESGFDKVLNVNVKGVFLLTRALVPMLTAAATDDDPARVINTGSVDGIVPPERGRNNFSYSASKAAVHMLTKRLAGELAPRILVNAIAPGLFQSRMTKELLSAGPDAVGSLLPLGRIGQPADMAGIAVFLASRASTYITGAIIPVDGGASVIR